MESVNKDEVTVKAGKKTTVQGKGSDKAEDKKGFIYIGPMLPNGKLKSNAVFTGSLKETEEHLKDVIEVYPMVRDLIVPLEDLAEQRVKTRTSGNYINECYKNVISDTKK